MASSSRSSRTKYDVFISFRGEDVRYGFLSHLTEKLQQNKIDVYVDEKFVMDDEMWPSPVDVIEQSRFSLIIFSRNYASSIMCLNDLRRIMECKDTHFVIPIFYHIDPTKFRHQIEFYEEALTKAANLVGFHASTYEKEAELVEQVVKSLSIRLNLWYPRSSRNNLVGIDENVEKLKTLMEQRSRDVRLIGIWGMDGIGKTTLATKVYHQFCDDYEGYYFQANVREESHKQGIVQLKKQIYERLLNKKNLDICTLIGLPSHVMRKLDRTKIFLVLDDINDSNQLESLIGAPDLFGLGSRIIVTTRDKEVLNGMVDNHNIYEVKPLVFDESLKLFNLNAFKEDCLDSELIELSKRVIEYAKGLPLALKVLGSFLRGKSKEEWKSQIEKLGRVSSRKINDVLRLSYDSLDDEQKTIFLYIACCFKGYKKFQIIDLLNAGGFSTSVDSKFVDLTVLQDRALITWSYEGPYVLMHDLIEEMGREIIREESRDPGKRSHLWNFEDVYKVFQNDLGTASIESIILDKFGIRQLSLNNEVFAWMDNLKFLVLPNVDLHQGLKYLPNELRLLCWYYYPLKSLPLTFCAKNLVQLIMRHSNLEKLWDVVMSLGNLKKIDLSWCKYLRELPNLEMAKNLEKVILTGCVSLCCVHPSIFSLPKLEKLILRGCQKLTSLGSNVHSKSLSRLNLHGCKRLEEFLVTSENMIDLDLSHTAVKELPLSFASQRKLEYLRLYRCKSLTDLRLPQSVEQVYATDCTSLKTVYLNPPPGKMPHLYFENCMELDVNSCKLLATRGCYRLTHLPYAFKLPGYVMEPRVIYPGSTFPDGFEHMTSQGSITMTIDPHYKLLGFIFCMILRTNSNFRVDCLLENKDGEMLPLDNENYYITYGGNETITELDLDHVCVCRVKCSGLINERVEESKGSDQNNLKLSFDFFRYIRDDDNGMEIEEVINRCGMHPIYDKWGR